MKDFIFCFRVWETGSGGVWREMRIMKGFCEHNVHGRSHRRRHQTTCCF